MKILDQRRKRRKIKRSKREGRIRATFKRKRCGGIRKLTEQKLTRKEEVIGGNLISWKSKKQTVMVRSSAEAKYRAMASTTCELIWLKQLLKELQFGETKHITLICDNQAALHIASNPVFHKRTKHIEVDCHYERRFYLETSSQVSSIQMTNLHMFLPNH